MDLLHFGEFFGHFLYQSPDVLSRSVGKFLNIYMQFVFSILPNNADIASINKIWIRSVPEAISK